MRKLIFVLVLFCFFSCAQTRKSKPIIYEVELASKLLELTKDVEHFPMYERKQIRKKLIDIHEYIMKQITDRIDKHPTDKSCFFSQNVMGSCPGKTGDF